LTIQEVIVYLESLHRVIPVLEAEPYDEFARLMRRWQKAMS
jgi:hypothetical protein